MTTTNIQNTAITPISNEIKLALQQAINSKTKPLGSLGNLEAIALQIGQIQKTLTPILSRPIVLVFAGDHGVVDDGVSSYPQAVTAQMVVNFLSGGAAINVFARQHGIGLRVVDSGVNFDFKQVANLGHAKIAFGTQNFLHQPAMTLTQCEKALTLGESFVNEEINAGTNILAFGEMGIGNTSSASCIMSLLCDLPISKCVGRGTGLNDAGLVEKTKVLSRAIDKHQLSNIDPIQVLSTFGGFEIAMMAGAMLAAAQQKAVLLIDGFIATSALLVAAKMQPNILQYCIFSHCSDESGHQQMLDYLKVKPLLSLGLRLGEGTGAVLAYPLVQSAVNFLNEMASYEQAGVSKSDTQH